MKGEENNYFFRFTLLQGCSCSCTECPTGRGVGEKTFRELVQFVSCGEILTSSLPIIQCMANDRTRHYIGVGDSFNRRRCTKDAVRILLGCLRRLTSRGRPALKDLAEGATGPPAASPLSLLNTGRGETRRNHFLNFHSECFGSWTKDEPCGRTRWKKVMTTSEQYQKDTLQSLIVNSRFVTPKHANKLVYPFPIVWPSGL